MLFGINFFVYFWRRDFFFCIKMGQGVLGLSPAWEENKQTMWYSPNVSTTSVTAMGCRQCFPLSVVQLKGKHCPKPHCCNGVVDAFRQCVASKVWTIENNTNFNYFFCLIKSSKIDFIFLPAFYLIMWLMTS